MKLTLKEIKELVDKEIILEIRLKRWLDNHFNTIGFASITSDRGNLPPEENEKNLKELKTLMRGAGYGFVKTEGGWEEDQGEEKLVSVTEASLMIPGKSTKMDDPKESLEALFDICKTVCEMYDQDAFLFGWGEYHDHRPETTGAPFAAVYDRSGKVLYGPFSEAEEGSALQVWSRLVKGADRRAKFTFTEWAAADPPNNQFEAMGRASEGEIFLAKPKTEV